MEMKKRKCRSGFGERHRIPDCPAGSFNYIHMMAAGVQNRSGELAALESIGMTQAQLKQMLMLEGAGYALLAEAASLAVGLPVSYAVFQGMNRYHMTYSFPLDQPSGGIYGYPGFMYPGSVGYFTAGRKGEASSKD